MKIFIVGSGWLVPFWSERCYSNSPLCLLRSPIAFSGCGESHYNFSHFMDQIDLKIAQSYIDFKVVDPCKNPPS